MGERQQITYMQARIVRLASLLWDMPINDAASIFMRGGALAYIERNFGLFHMEGDEAVLADVEAYLAHKGVHVRGKAAG